MNKPFSMVCEEFKQGLANLINESCLPICIIEFALQNCLNEVSNIAKSQYQNDKARYEQSLLDEKYKDEKSDKE